MQQVIASTIWARDASRRTARLLLSSLAPLARPRLARRRAGARNSATPRASSSREDQIREVRLEHVERTLQASGVMAGECGSKRVVTFQVICMSFLHKRSAVARH
jgi:hypothetical protein